MCMAPQKKSKEKYMHENSRSTAAAADMLDLSDLKHDFLFFAYEPLSLTAGRNSLDFTAVLIQNG